MEIVLKKARRLAEDYYSKLLPESAVFWAEKALLLSKGEIDDIVLYCQCLYLGGQYRRVVAYLENSGLLNRSSALRYLAGKCLVACKAWNEVITLFKEQEGNEELFGSENSTNSGGGGDKEDVTSNRLGNVSGAPIRLLLAKAYDATGSISEAIHLYKEALTEDPYCEEAIERLYSLHALEASEEQNQMSSLSFSGETSVEEELVTKYLYQCKLRHVVKKPQHLPEKFNSLLESIDVLSYTANLYLVTMNIEKCLKLTQMILCKDPYHSGTLLTRIACLVINQSSRDLYSLGQDLVKHFPDSPLSWYAVGCYYHTLNGDYHPQMRKYLSKAINLDPHYAYAHLALGLTFASKGEHDQAITAFSHAARYMKSSYLPMMYLGKEYAATGNLQIAISFFKSALLLNSNNPCLLQEVGLLLAENKSYAKAETYFRRAAVLLNKLDPHGILPLWEPIHNNLGHVLRKQGKYNEALDAHHKALQLIPNEPSTLTAIAFVYLLLEDYKSVVHYCNQSLRIRREDQVTIEIMQNAVNEIASIPLDTKDISPIVMENIYSINEVNTAMQTD